MAPTSTQSAGTGRRAGIDRDAIVDAALALVEADGAAALTMRRLATALDVTTTTIYWHIGGREEVVTALIRRLSERLAERDVEGSTPTERVMSAAHHVWDSALTHRHVTGLAYQSGAISLLELPLQTALVRELEAAGLTGPDARDALQAILMCVAGFLVVALRSEAAVPPEYRPQALWATVGDDEVTPATLAALGQPPDLPRLFDTTLRSVVESLVGDRSQEDR